MTCFLPSCPARVCQFNPAAQARKHHVLIPSEYKEPCEKALRVYGFSHCHVSEVFPPHSFKIQENFFCHLFGENFLEEFFEHYNEHYNELGNGTNSTTNSTANTTTNWEMERIRQRNTDRTLQRIRNVTNVELQGNSISLQFVLFLNSL